MNEKQDGRAGGEEKCAGGVERDRDKTIKKQNVTEKKKAQPRNDSCVTSCHTACVCIGIQDFTRAFSRPEKHIANPRTWWRHC